MTASNRKSNFLFRPAIALMNRLKYPQKFALITLLFAILLATVIFLLISEMNDRIEFSQKEIYGDAYLVPLRGLLESVPEARRLAHEFAIGQISVRPQLITQLSKIDENLEALQSVEEDLGAILKTGRRYATIRENWRFLKTKTIGLQSTDIVSLYNKFFEEVLALISYVGDTSNLILDPDLDSYYLMDEVLLKLPEGANLLARAEFFGQEILRRGSITAEEKAEFIILKGLIRSNLDATRKGLGVAFQNNPRQNLKSVLTQPLEDYTNAIEQLLQVIELQILNPLAIEIHPQTYVDTASRAQTATFNLWDETVVQLDGLVSARINGFARKRTLVTVLSFIILMLVVYLLIGFYRAVMLTVDSLDEASRRMIKGDLKQTLAVKTRDEMGTVIESFNSIATGLLEAKEKYRSIFENAVEGIFQSTPRGNFLSVNPAMARIFGFSSEEQMLSEVNDISAQLYVDPTRRDEFVKTLQEKGSISEFESQAYRKDRSVIWISEKVHPVRSNTGEILYFEGSMEDITERKLAEEELKQKTALLKVLQEVSTAANQASNETEALHIGLEQICNFTGWPVGHVYIRSPYSDSGLTPTSIWHLSDPSRFETFREITEAMPLKKG